MKIVTLPFLYIFSLFFIQKLNPLLSIEVPIGGNTFQTKGANLELLDKDGIKSWTSTESVWSTYIFSGSEKKITLSLELTEIPSKNKIDVWVNDGSRGSTYKYLGQFVLDRVITDKATVDEANLQIENQRQSVDRIFKLLRVQQS